jgi:type IV pilus assembly protein PilM
MFGLSFGKNVFIGVDIGTSAIKIVEIKNNSGKPVLSNYAWMSFDGYFKKSDSVAMTYEKVLPQYLKRIIKESGIKSKNAHTSIPAFGGLITLIEFPQMDRNDIEQAIKFEAHKYIPTSLDEVVLNWDVVNENPAAFSRESEPGNVEIENEKLQVLLVAASKNKVKRYEKMIVDAGLKLESIEIESFSIARSLIGNDQGNFIIADIGSRVCNILLVEKGIIMINRNIDAGGRDIAQTIAKSMAISDERAEKLKLGGKNFFASDSYINFPSLELIRDEIARTANAYSQSGNKIKIDNLILSGGTANMTGLTGYFNQALGIKTIIGNPFGRIICDKKIEPALKMIGTRFSVAAGLALKGMERNK